ncbi:hypothetical protein DYB38_003283 [Aphanomyces astaci]|uniref:Uncharacterized protein n=1 Tax=Aphanomyces astaci TaxID=112090 RepID=A0A397CYP0_APHAT|nr:hypothetical protein DYB38_003283 [Aphanomyces astaci]
MTGGSPSPPRGRSVVVGSASPFPSASSTPAMSIKTWTAQALKRFHGMNTSPPRRDSMSPSSSHNRDRCMALGECDPRCIVDNMHFQGGVHHTQMLFAVFNGRPLSHCCYDMTFTWFRARHDDEFAVIPHASMDWYQPTAEDIGASLLLQVEIDDAVLGCIEHGPLVAGTPHLGLKKRLMEGDPCIDPSVRSRVETFLAAHTAYFTVHINTYHYSLACSFSFISERASDASVSLDAHHANAFVLEFGTCVDDTSRAAARLVVDLHDQRDVLFLVFRAFSSRAVHSTALADAISSGQSCMLACRTLPPPSSSLTDFDVCIWSHGGYMLPWTSTAGRPTIHDDDEEDVLNSMLLHDVDALLLLTHEFCTEVMPTSPESCNLSAPAAAAARDEEGEGTSMQSALESIKAERRALERQLEHLRHHHQSPV